MKLKCLCNNSKLIFDCIIGVFCCQFLPLFKDNCVMHSLCWGLLYFLVQLDLRLINKHRRPSWVGVNYGIDRPASLLSSC